MPLWKIAWRNMTQRKLSSFLTGLSMALGVALVVAVLVVYGVVKDSFGNAAEGYSIIVGAKGGRLQLVLNTVYHLSTPIENIPWDYYTEFIATPEKKGRFSNYVEVAIPYCLGDNYEGFRVVGTTADLFTRLGLGRDPEGNVLQYQFSEGGVFDPGKPFEAVIGSVAAYRTGLKLGDTFAPTHGVSGGPGAHAHDENPFKVVGILAPTGTPNDRALFVNIEGFFLLEGHAKVIKRPVGESPDAAAHGAHDDQQDHELLPDEQREVTAILLRTSSPIADLSLPRVINKEQYAQAAMPTREIFNLFDAIIGPMQMLLLGLAGMVVLVAGIGIMVSIYNSMNDRRRDIAIMRALGASRRTISQVVLLESALISILAGVGGWLLAHGLIAVLNPFLTAQTGVSIGFFDWATFQVPLGRASFNMPYEVAVLLGLMAVSILIGFLPAASAHRTDVAKALG